MQTSAISGGSALFALQRLFRGAGDQAGAGQEAPSAGQKSPIAGATGCGGPQMGAQTMAAVLGLQTSPPSDSDIASQLVKSLDTDGDGQVSQNEIQSALQQAGVNSDVSTAFASADSDGDGKLSLAELTTAVGLSRAHHHHGGPPPGGPPPSASDAANGIVSAFNTDGQDGLSLNEVGNALGQDASSDALKSTFGTLDANGDGVLSADELASAIQAQIQTAQAAYAARLSERSGESQVAASV